MFQFIPTSELLKTIQLVSKGCRALVPASVIKFEGQKIDINDDRLKFIAESYPNIWSVDLSRGGKTNTITLDGLRNLRTLSLQSIRIMGWVGIAQPRQCLTNPVLNRWVGEFSKLKSLVVSHVNRENISLKGLGNLEYLEISDSIIIDEDLECLQNSKSPRN